MSWRRRTVARWGCVVVDSPRLDDQTLLMADIGSSNDWGDEDGATHRDNRAHQLFARIKRQVGNRLERPTYAWNRRDGVVVAYGDVGHTRGVRELAQHGVRLQQHEVENVFFSPRRPTRQEIDATARF